MPRGGEHGQYYRHLGDTVGLVAISDAQRRITSDLNSCATVRNAIDATTLPFRADKPRFHPDTMAAGYEHAYRRAVGQASPRVDLSPPQPSRAGRPRCMRIRGGGRNARHFGAHGRPVRSAAGERADAVVGAA